MTILKKLCEERSSRREAWNALPPFSPDTAAAETDIAD
jgi:hypothetical protein